VLLANQLCQAGTARPQWHRRGNSDTYVITFVSPEREETAITETPPDEGDADLDDPIEPRVNPAEALDVEGDGDGDDTLVSEGDPPSTAND
jgi:hypothetical protein